jgi:hypothetical protein
VVDAAAQREDHVLMPPHHALGHAGAAAGVEHVEVVRRARPEGARRRSARERLGIGEGATPAEVLAAVVVDRDPMPQQRHLVFYRLDPGGEAAVVDQRLEIRVVEQVAELVLDVAIVHVDRDGAQLVGAEHALDELDAVEGVDPDVIAGADPDRGQVVGEPVRALLELGVGPPLVAADQRLPVGREVDDALDQIGDVPFHAGTLRERRGRAGQAPAVAGSRAIRAPRRASCTGAEPSVSSSCFAQR